MSKTTVLPFVSRQACPKCGADRLTRDYEASIDALVFSCNAREGCGYRFCTEPKDAPSRGASPRTVEVPAGVDGEDSEVS